MILNIIVNKKIDPIEIINNKIDKNEKKYPIEKAKGVRQNIINYKSIFV